MRAGRLLRLTAGGLAALAAAACDPARPAPTDELTIVVQGDRRELEAQEKALKARESALEGEQEKLAARIEELAKSRAAADQEHRRRLDDELTSARTAQDELSRRVAALQQQKAAVEVQRSALAAPDDGRSPLSVREAMLAAREAKLGAREAALAQREADLAARERALLAREPQPAQAAQAEPAPQVPTRAETETAHRRLIAEMGARGILVSDLPAESQPLNAAIFAARRQGDYARAADLVADLSRAVQRLRIDQRFVEQKMTRLQSARAGARLDGGKKGEVEELLREVTSSFSDGQFDRANKGLNRIAAILDASAEPG